MASRGNNHGERITRLEADLEATSRDVHAIREQQAAMATDLREIRDAILTGKGGWKIAISLLGLAGGIMISLATAWAIQWFGPKGGG
jgi:hypothetical protein